MLPWRAALLFTFLAIAVPALADPSVRVLTEDFPPFSYLEDGKIVGTSTQTVRAVLDEAGLDYHMDIMPWKRAMHTAEHTPNTLIYSMTRLPEREKRFLWLVPLSDNPSHLYCRKGREDLLGKTVEELHADSVICIQDGTSGPALLLGLGFSEENLLRVTDQDNRMCMRIVQTGGADFFARSDRKHAMMTDEDDPFQRHPELELHETLYLAANRDTDTDIVRRIREAHMRLVKQDFREAVD